MKVHYITPLKVDTTYRAIANQSWQREGLIPYVAKLCDGLMVRKEDAHRLTEDKASVTCIRCKNVLRKLK